TSFAEYWNLLSP
nr:Chain B, 12-mer peptide inhibitor [synthetic construct]3EQY_C Chain C, 12-mer peptide inhibitor [synthetic construct]3EQY_D Chain D, 12-mer peptide inhibitor [synthetic construct]4RXZ_C Chain C, 12-MER PEPTIDE INHIBITOR [synthetic construct]4RXZ_D Chain D, 12-MER PEPTIDE INHIBITOR [synthetic construct]